MSSNAARLPSFEVVLERKSTILPKPSLYTATAGQVRVRGRDSQHFRNKMAKTTQTENRLFSCFFVFFVATKHNVLGIVHDKITRILCVESYYSIACLELGSGPGLQAPAGGFVQGVVFVIYMQFLSTLLKQHGAVILLLETHTLGILRTLRSVYSSFRKYFFFVDPEKQHTHTNKDRISAHAP